MVCSARCLWLPDFSHPPPISPWLSTIYACPAALQEDQVLLQRLLPEFGETIEA